jgi:peptidoglycan hydrolase-like protein with peptidoglycan-binding domain
MKFLRRSTPACIALLSIFCLALPQLTIASAPFSQNLQLRDTGDGVTRLQQFLNAEHFLIAQSGPGSPGNETTTFGLLTYQALIQFQSANGLPATGFFGSLTRNFIATLAASSTGTSTAPSVATTTAVASPSPTTTPAFSRLSSTTSVYVPGVTPLPGYAPGQLIFIGGGAPAPAAPPASPPTPAPYVAKAVHFDGNTLIKDTSPTGTPSPFLIASMWFKGSVVAPVAPAIFRTMTTLFQARGADIGSTVFVDTDGTIEIGIVDDTNSNGVVFDSVAGAVSEGQWHNLIVSCDASTASPTCQARLDDVDVPLILKFPFGGAFNLDLFSPNFYALDLSTEFIDPQVGDAADLFISTAGPFDLNAESNRRKFIDSNGKPADLGSSCVNPTGTLPAFCLSGNASTFGTNKGTGGAFTLTGTLTDADTSPSN